MAYQSIFKTTTTEKKKTTGYQSIFVNETPAKPVEAPVSEVKAPVKGLMATKTKLSTATKTPLYASKFDMSKVKREEPKQVKPLMATKFDLSTLARERTLPSGGQFLSVSGFPGILTTTPRAYGTLKTKVGEERDHIIPVSLGGNSNDPNMQYLKSDKTLLQKIFNKPVSFKNRQEGKVVVELKAINDYKAGKITLGEARNKVINWKDQSPSLLKLWAKEFIDVGKKQWEKGTQKTLRKYAPQFAKPVEMKEEKIIPSAQINFESLRKIKNSEVFKQKIKELGILEPTELPSPSKSEVAIESWGKTFFPSQIAILALEKIKKEPISLSEEELNKSHPVINLLSKSVGSLANFYVIGKLLPAFPISKKLPLSGLYPTISRGIDFFTHGFATGAIKGFFDETLNQIRKEKFEPSKIAKETLKTGAFVGLVAAPSASLSPLVRIGGAGLVAGNWDLLEAKIKKGEITSEDATNALVDSIMMMTLTALGTWKAEEQYRAKEMSNFQEGYLKAKIKGNFPQWTEKQVNSQYILLKTLGNSFTNQISKPLVIEKSIQEMGLTIPYEVKTGNIKVKTEYAQNLSKNITSGLSISDAVNKANIFISKIKLPAGLGIKEVIPEKKPLTVEEIRDFEITNLEELLSKAQPIIQDMVNTGDATMDESAEVGNILEKIDKVKETPEDIRNIRELLGLKNLDTDAKIKSYLLEKKTGFKTREIGDTRKGYQSIFKPKIGLGIEDVGVRNIEIVRNELIENRNKINEISGKSISNFIKSKTGKIEAKTGTPKQIVELIDKHEKLRQELLSLQEVSPKISPEKVSPDITPIKPEIAKEIEKKVVSQKFRSDKLNLEKNQIRSIEQRLDILGLTERKVRTFKDMELAAQELGTDVKTLLRESATNRLTDKEIVGLKNLINNNAELVSKLTLQTPKTTVEEIEIKRKISIANQQIDTALSKIIKGGTEAGRTVASFRILANKTLDPQFWFLKAQKVLGNQKITPEIKTAILDLIKKSDRQGLANFVSMLRKPSFVEKAITLWKAGLLTSPTTHLANIGGNLTMTALMTASDVIATPLDILASVFTGKRTVTISPQIIYQKIKGGIKGIKEAKQYAKTGIYSQDILNKYDLPKQINFNNKILNGYTQAVFRSLGAEDIIFRQASMSESLSKQAKIIAINEKLKGSEYNNRIKELLLNPTNEMVSNAIDVAEYATFQDENILADLISGAKAKVAKKGFAGEVTYATVEILAPFVKTPTNIADRIADFSPVGFIKAFIKVARPTRSQQIFIEDISRAIVGTSIILFGAYLAKKGLMTGNPPEKKKERDQWYAEGKQSNAIRIGDYWFQLNRTSPFGNLLALGAEFEKLSQEKAGIELGVATTFAGIKGLTEQTFLKGVSGGLKAITQPEEEAGKFAEQTIASTVPSLIGRIARTIDPYLKVPSNILETLKAKIPFLTKGIPLRRDIFGEPVKVSGGRAIIFDPFATKKVIEDPVIKEAKAIGVTIGLPVETISGTKLTNVEYSKYQKVHGRILKTYLSALIKNKDYQQLSIIEREKEFNKMIANVKSEINDLIFPALMIIRYNLPDDTQPQILRDLLSTLNKEEEFKKMKEEKKEKVIKSLLEKIQ